MSKGVTRVNHYSTIHQQVWTRLFCISCVCFGFPQFFQNYKIAMSLLHLASRDQDMSYSSLHSVESAPMLWPGISLGTAPPNARAHEAFWPASVLTSLASVSPKGEERWLTFLFTPTAQALLSGFSGKCMLTERMGLELGWWDGKGILALATALPKLRQQGLGKGNQVKSLSIQTSTLSCSPLHLFFTRPGFPPLGCVAAVEGTRTRQGAPGVHTHGTRDCGSFFFASCIEST